MSTCIACKGWGDEWGTIHGSVVPKLEAELQRQRNIVAIMSKRIAELEAENDMLRREVR